MPKEPLETQQLSSEVVGKFTPNQANTLKSFVEGVVNSLNLEPGNPDHQKVAVKIVVNCFSLGLDLAGREWIARNEDVATYFERGLEEREGVVQRLNNYAQGASHLGFLTKDEEIQASEVKVLDVDFETGEKLLAGLLEKEKVIRSFHTKLFDESALSEEATEIRADLQKKAESEGRGEQDHWSIYNRLYANFLANLAFYRRPGVKLEPKDISALSKTWEDPQVQERSRAYLFSVIETIAKQLKLPEDIIMLYTANILKDINAEFGVQETTIDGLIFSDVFAVTSEDIQREREEIEEPVTDEVQIVSVLEEEVLEARSAFERLRSLREKLAQLTEKEAESLTNEVYIPYLQQFSPLDLLFVLRDLTFYLEDYTKLSDKQREEEVYLYDLREDLVQFVPLITYIEILPLVFATQIRVGETKERLDILDGPIGTEIKDEITERVLEGVLTDELIDRGIGFAEVVQRVPVGFLTDLIIKIDESRIPDEYKQVLLSLGINQWYKIARVADINVFIDKATDTFEFSPGPGSENIVRFLTQLPTDKQRAIAEKLSNIVTF